MFPFRLYDVVKPDDLFSALQEAATADGSIQNYTANVKQVFESWTSKSGYPVLDVSMDHSDHSINVKQVCLETNSNLMILIIITLL